METALLIGVVAGACVGAVHAVQVYLHCLKSSTGSVLRARARAGYFALWTFGLWVLFGSYVLTLWIVAAGIHALAGSPAAPRADAGN